MADHEFARERTPAQLRRMARAGAESAKTRRERSVNPLAAPDPLHATHIDYSPAQLEFIAAVQAYQKRTGRKFPAFSELFAILTDELGYRKTTLPE